MTNEERVQELETIASEHLAEMNATGLLLTALIASHPNPKAVLAAFDLSVSNYETQAGDQGYERAIPPPILQDLLARMRPHMERYRAALQAAARSG